MSQSVIASAKGVTKKLGSGAGEVTALDNVSLDIKSGELTLLMGPSGSGKTTLLSILGCILTPTNGDIKIAGETTQGLSPEVLADVRRRHVGFVFQSYNLFPTLNALENVRLALDVRGLAYAETIERAELALREVGLSHRLKSYPGNMSGGEQQRVAVARAIATAPSLILADEPTAALDSENGHAVMALLSEVAQHEQRAVLAVTHDPRTHAYADRIVRIEDGRIIGDERKPNAKGNVTQIDRTRKRKQNA
ncbi:MAG: ABC transporter ATP-binding protein [Pseudomonadota bacterium]